MPIYVALGDSFARFTPKLLILWLHSIQHPFHRHGIKLLAGAGTLPFFVEPVGDCGQAHAFVLAQNTDVVNELLVGSNGRSPIKR